jgi:hypothetical protein
MADVRIELCHSGTWGQHEPVADDFSAVSLPEITKVLGVNNLSLKPACLDDSAPQQSTVNPFLHLFCADMQRFRQGVFREPIVAHASARSQSVQHGPNRGWRAPEQHCDLLQRMRCDQVEQFLLFSFCPLPMASLRGQPGQREIAGEKVRSRFAQSDFAHRAFNFGNRGWSGWEMRSNYETSPTGHEQPLNYGAILGFGLRPCLGAEQAIINGGAPSMNGQLEDLFG